VRGVTGEPAVFCGCMVCWCAEPVDPPEAVCEDCRAGVHYAAPSALPTPNGVAPKCKRHRWDRTLRPVACARCGRVRDEARSRSGRNARSRGNRHELRVARAFGGVKVGHHGGPEDVRVGMFVVQVKYYATARFPAWMDNELKKLPRTDGRVPLLVVAESAGQGRKGRAIAVLDLGDMIDLHGEVVP
jgi:hypothetical protein